MSLAVFPPHEMDDTMQDDASILVDAPIDMSPKHSLFTADVSSAMMAPADTSMQTYWAHPDISMAPEPDRYADIDILAESALYPHTPAEVDMMTADEQVYEYEMGDPDVDHLLYEDTVVVDDVEPQPLSLPPVLDVVNPTATAESFGLGDTGHFSGAFEIPEVAPVDLSAHQAGEHQPTTRNPESEVPLDPTEDHLQQSPEFVDTRSSQKDEEAAEQDRDEPQEEPAAHAAEHVQAASAYDDAVHHVEYQAPEAQAENEPHEETKNDSASSTEEYQQHDYPDQSVVPPILITAHLADSRIYSLFSAPEMAAIASSSNTPLEAPVVLVAEQPELFFQPVVILLKALRVAIAEADVDLDQGLFEWREFRISARELQLELTEDNIYSTEVSLFDLSTLHQECGLSGYLHLDLTLEPRFIARYRKIKEGLAAEAQKSNEQYGQEPEATGTVVEQTNGDDNENEETNQQDRQDEGGAAFPETAEDVTAHEEHSHNQEGEYQELQYYARDEDDVQENQAGSPETTKVEQPEPTEATEEGIATREGEGDTRDNEYQADNDTDDWGTIGDPEFVVTVDEPDDEPVHYYEEYAEDDGYVEDPNDTQELEHDDQTHGLEERLESKFDETNTGIEQATASADPTVNQEPDYEQIAPPETDEAAQLNAAQGTATSPVEQADELATTLDGSEGWPYNDVEDWDDHEDEGYVAPTADATLPEGNSPAHYEDPALGAGEPVPAEHDVPVSATSPNLSNSPRKPAVKRTFAEVEEDELSDSSSPESKRARHE